MFDSREYGSDFDCIKCDIDTLEIGEYYMVHNHIWLSANSNPNGNGMMCIGCLEQQLGRRLTLEDFTSAPINHMRRSYRSNRLEKRLAA